MQEDLTHYEVLDVNSSASLEQIRQRYYQLARKFHPDKQIDLPEQLEAQADQQFLRIQQAWEILREPASRKQYDGTTELRYMYMNISILIYQIHMQKS
jgi:diphthamide biosynthesis protein 4